MSYYRMPTKDDTLLTEISPFLRLKGAPSKEIDVGQLTYGENIEREGSEEDFKLQIEIAHDSICNPHNLLTDIAAVNNAEKAEKIYEIKNDERLSLPNKSQVKSDMIIHCPESNNTVIVDNTNIQEFPLLQNLSILKVNKIGSMTDTGSEPSHGTKIFIGKQLIQKTSTIEEKQHRDKDLVDETIFEWKNSGERVLNATQQAEQQFHNKAESIFCTSSADISLDEVQSYETVEASPLMDQQQKLAYLSSTEKHDNFQNPSNTKHTCTDLDIACNVSIVKKETESESMLYPGNETLQNSNLIATEFKSPAKKSDLNEYSCAKKEPDSSSCDNIFKKTIAIPIKPTCANGKVLMKLFNKPLVYSGEIAKAPCVAINKAISNFILESPNQSKKMCIPIRLNYQNSNNLKSESITNTPSESKVPPLTPLSPVTSIYPNLISSNTASTISNSQRDVIKHVPTILASKTQKQNGVKALLIKSILPSTLKMVAKRVSVSGFSPMASSEIYTIAGSHTPKTHTMCSSAPKITPLILQSTKTAVRNTEVNYSVSDSQSTSGLLHAEIPVTKSTIMTSLPVLPSTAKEFSKEHNVTIVSSVENSTSVSNVKVPTQELENNVANGNALQEDVFFTNATPSKLLNSVNKLNFKQISSTESSKLNSLSSSDAAKTEDLMAYNIDKQQMVKAHPNGNNVKTGKEQRKRKARCGSGTKRKEIINAKKTIVFIPPTRKNRKILPKCEIKSSDVKPKELGIISTTIDLDKMNEKTVNLSETQRMSIQQKQKIITNFDSSSSDGSLSKSDILSKETTLPSSTDYKMLDTLKPAYSEFENKSIKITESNIFQQDLKEGTQYSDSTSQKLICNASVGSDKRQPESTFMQQNVYNAENGSQSSVSMFSSNLSDHYQTKYTQNYSPLCDKTSSSEPQYRSAEYSHPRKLTEFDVNAGKELNNFPADNQTSLVQGKLSSVNDERHKIQDMFPCNGAEHQRASSFIANSPLSNGDAYNSSFGNYNNIYNDDKFIQTNYLRVPENENQWCQTSKEWEYVPQHLYEASQNHSFEVNAGSDNNKYNAHYQISKIGPNVPDSNWDTIGEENSVSLLEKNFSQPCTSNEQAGLAAFFNYKKQLTEYLHESVSAKDNGGMQHLQNASKEKHARNYQNKANMQHFEKYKRNKRKMKEPSKSFIKFERDKPYICCFCGKAEQYNVILQRHMKLEHGYIPAASAKV